MSHSHDIEVPKPLLIGAAALILFALTATATVRLTGAELTGTAPSAIVETVSLQFKDEPDGGVSVYNHDTGERIWLYEPTTGGFVRVALRALAHERQLKGGVPEDAFTLNRMANGRIVIEDPVTGRSIGLEAFGNINANDFAQLFTVKETQG